MRIVTNFHLTLALVASSLLVGPTLRAQADWKKASPGTKPSARGNTQFAADNVNLYVFGGNANGTTFYNDLWSYRVNTWVKLTSDGAAGSPAKRRWGSACWDFGRSQLVVFGGQDANKKNLADTWVYANGSWTQKTPAVSPAARRWAGMAYDWANGRVLLFGGYGTGNLNDTWAWNGATWIKLSPKTQPPIKSRMGMVAIATSKEILIYGGTTTSSTATPTTEMWKWDGTDWTKVTQTGGPTSGVEPGMVYDEFRDVVVFYGGHNSYPRSDTWEWDGKAWSQKKVTSPGPRSRPSIGYVSALKKTIFFGGYTGALPMKDDTWIYETDKPAMFTFTGTACKSSAGLPVLNGAALPWTDSTMILEATPVPAAAPVLASLGLSKANWGAITLPLDLTVFGASGCRLYTGLDVVVVAPTTNGTATLAVPIPAMPALAGAKLFDQFLILDTSANSLGIAFSGLAEAQIGVR